MPHYDVRPCKNRIM